MRYLFRSTAPVLCLIVLVPFLFGVACSPDREEAETALEQGLFFFGSQNYSAAILSYDNAIRLDSNYAKAYHVRGKAWYELRQYQRAIQDYDKAIRLGFDEFSVYNNRAWAWYKLGELGNYQKDLANACDIDRLKMKAVLAGWPDQCD